MLIFLDLFLWSFFVTYNELGWEMFFPQHLTISYVNVCCFWLVNSETFMIILNHDSFRVSTDRDKTALSVEFLMSSVLG